MDKIELDHINSSLSSPNELQLKASSPYSKCKFYLPYSSLGIRSTSMQQNLNAINEIRSEKKEEEEEGEDDDEDENTINSVKNPLLSTRSQQNEIKSQNSSSNHVSSQKEESKRNEAKVEMSQRKKRPSIPIYLRKSSLAKQTNLDHLLQVVGSFGFYQKIQFFLVGIMAILPSMVAYSYVFVSAAPKFTCKTALEVSLYKVASLGTESFNAPAGFSDVTFDLQRSEFIIENRRFIKVLKDANITQKQVSFDNKCQFTSQDIQTIIKTNRLLADKNLNLTLVRSSLECIEWHYDDKVYGRTLVTDLNLICLKSYMKAATQNAFILGTGCSVFTGILSDKYGRRTALILLITLMFLILNISQILMHSSALTTNQKFILFVISRFIQGVGTTMYSVCFVLLLEITGPRDRVTAGNILAYSFSVGQMVLVSVAYFFKDWRKVQWILAIYIMPFFMYYWLVPESPRWLLSTYRVRDTISVLKKITNVNTSFDNFYLRIKKLIFFKSATPQVTANQNVIFNSDASSAYIFTLLQDEANNLKKLRKNTSYKQTLNGITKSPILIRRCLIIFYNWMVILALYLGIGMGISGNLDKYMNPYIVFFIAAMCEFISIITCHLVLNKFGRKNCYVFFMILCSLAIYLIPVYFHSYPALAIFFYFLAKYAIGAAQAIFMIYTSELYPTPMRSTGVGLSVAIARLGGVWAPQINVLSSTLGSIYIPFIIFSVAGLLSSILCIFLPETLNKPLPENITEAKELK